MPSLLQKRCRNTAHLLGLRYWEPANVWYQCQVPIANQKSCYGSYIHWASPLKSIANPSLWHYRKWTFVFPNVIQNQNQNHNRHWVRQSAILHCWAPNLQWYQVYQGFPSLLLFRKPNLVYWWWRQHRRRWVVIVENHPIPHLNQSSNLICSHLFDLLPSMTLNYHSARANPLYSWSRIRSQ